MTFSPYSYFSIQDRPFDSSTLVAGPHGTAQTAIKSTSSANAILQVKDKRLTTNDGSFTIAFFIKTASDSSSGGIFEFIDSEFSTTDKSFQLQYSGHTIMASANTKITDQYNLLQRKSTWTFLAFAYDGDTFDMSVYSEHGLAYSPRFQPYLLGANIFNNGGVRLGYSTFAGKGLNNGDAVSCLSIYSKALQWPQIKQLQEACRITHGSPLWGAPKLPYNPIPSSSPPITTVPKEGQFPWLGILETDDGALVCSVSILDEYWALTSAECFDPKNINDYIYYVKVGVHDIALQNGYTKQHEIEKFIKSGTSKRDIALIQFKNPIDFTSDYVNDACLFDGDPESIKLQNAQFVSGWGINGRNTFISKTLPRYVPGNILTDSYCSRAWGQSFDSDVDFCFQSSTTEKDIPCKGDEGSPLLFQGEPESENVVGDRLIQVGIYYGRDDSCSAGKPGLFTDIHRFQNWITEQMACAVPGSGHEPVKCPQ